MEAEIQGAVKNIGRTLMGSCEKPHWITEKPGSWPVKVRTMLKKLVVFASKVLQGGLEAT
ncbi:Hypothetical predicted protein [Podarcis lilfordi]|uniref:Uncharacterized protein n=1 Tax=Podarcis lilfordi TaxID=74358 RepID=A0AA35PQ71_9SAUR|nr:Hypothetical predicted protein [Podarcis lilfordi]